MTILVADAGGTYIRFALSHNGINLSEPQKSRVADFPTLEDAIDHFLFTERVESTAITHFYIGVGGRNPWSYDRIGKALPHADFVAVNDFEANAYGVIAATPDDVVLLAGEPHHVSRQGSARAVIGSGTGLGLAYILRTPHGPFVQKTHGGHMLPATFLPDMEHIVAKLNQLYHPERAPIYEDILAGYGIFDVYKMLSAQMHVDIAYQDTNDLIARGRNNPIVEQTLAIYHDMLGLFAHHVLAFGYAYEGLYLTGGVTDRLVGANLFDVPRFMATLQQNMVQVVRDDVANTPIYWLKDEYISLRGLLILAQQARV